MDKFHGHLYILFGATLWGVSGAVAKSLFNIGISPAELVHVRLTLATLTLALILSFIDRKRMLWH
jgi:drug/metabolite transporter (DMT)-like permease